MLPTGFDILSANADNHDGNQDPTSPEVGKETSGICALKISVKVKRDFMRCKPETRN